jgi:hypothetical protein
VDFVHRGQGSTNNGNVARRFCECPATTAAIIGLDKSLIRRFAVILQALSSMKTINIDAYREFANETAKLYVHLYPWYYMTPTVHKIFIHGAEIIQHALVAIGQLSEEAQEALNEDFKHIREFNTRKCSRIATNEDLLNHLFISSDPVITNSLEIFYKKPKKMFDKTYT